ncbi:MAG: hypothetical protein MK213_00560 [Planctomycetes bacterium]|nr:hypothetical protein [Planctomycetota bacterium]
MNWATFLIPLLLLTASCGNKPPPRDNSGISETLRPDQAPQATDRKIEMPNIAPPKAKQSLYIAHLRNDQGQSIGGARTMLLQNKPDGLYMREPRRKDVIATYKSPLHGRVHFMAESDQKPKYLWVGGDGFDPFVKELSPATSGATDERTIEIKILPICKMVILDHLGYLVPEAIVTLKPGAGNNFGQRPGSGNVGNTQRADDAGEVSFTRPAGKYILIAAAPSKTNHGRIERPFDWDGTPGKIEVRLAKP